MEVEKKRSKGGFFHLFDWHGKSRKKLFSNNSELPEGSKQGKENVGNAVMSRIHMIEVDESRTSSSNKESSDKGSCDFNYASSMTSDEGYGTRAPGVVAKLMGLDSLPTSNVPQLCSSTFSHSRPLRGSHYERSTPDLWSECYLKEYLNIPNKLESISWNPVESRLNKVQNRPIERFQIETLPPKSAKSIPSTHHKLLSPIRSPGFILSKNAAYIMEAATRIIEPSPKVTNKGKVLSIGSSSVPLRIRDLKEKLEATHNASKPQKSNQPCAAKYTKGRCSDKSNSVAESTAMCNASEVSGKEISGNGRSKGKSVSLAVQAKVNVQRREASTSSSNRSSMRQKEKSDVKANQFFKSQPAMQRAVHKGTSANKTNTVLRHNNQKQNCKDNMTSRTAVPNQQSRKAKSTKGSTGANRIINKVVLNSEIGSKKTGSVTTRTEKEISSRRKNLSRIKQSENEDLEERVSDNISIVRGEKSIKCNVAFDGDKNLVADNLKKDMDVVSFTFSSPMTRSMPDPQSSSQVMEKDMSFGIGSFGDNDLPYSRSLTFASPCFNVIGGDALNALLEQKLRELACKVESSQCNAIREETSRSTLQDPLPTVNGVTTSSAEQDKRLLNGLDKDRPDSLDDSEETSRSSLQDSLPTINGVTTSSAEQDKRLLNGLDKDRPDSRDDSDCFSIDEEGLNLNQKWQVQQSEATEEHSSSSINCDSLYEFDCPNSSPASIIEPSFTNGSCSDNRNSTNGGKKCLLMQDQKAFSRLPTNESRPAEDGIQLSESASSSMGTFSLIDSKEFSNWELDYVRYILNNAELMLKEFALGQTDEVINPRLFDQLENQENGMESNEEEYSKLGRKALFDCVSECLDLRCGQLSVGSCKAWVKCSTLIRRKGWLAEESYKEILSWKSMGDLMEDELVDRDMSSRHGRWLDFDKEACEESVEIEKEILTSLVYELVSDFFAF